jgi:hypothetical protein
MAGARVLSVWMIYVHRSGLSAMVSVALFMILDIEFPRHGMVNLKPAHELSIDLENIMHMI